ncbi:MAG: ABC transporter permease [Candidatus Microsyncoccus archaeolyticus]|nr:MAG: ABC transporter permease [Candidatus Parcubacteria bacterium]
MFLSDLIEETYTSLTSNKVRSILTILGIVIGIASVITMISIGQGSAKDIEDNIQSLGSNLLIVSPGSQRTIGTTVRGGFGSASTLVMEDAEVIESQVSNLNAVAPLISSREQVVVKGENTNTSIYGVTQNYEEVRDIEMEIGFFITEIYVEKKSKVAVLGPTTRDTLFGEGIDPTGEKIKIDGQEYTVIGVTKSKGSSGMNNADDLIYIPISVAKQYITGSESLSSIYIEVSSEKFMEKAEEDVNSLLMERHKIKDEDSVDFSITNQSEVMETMTSVSETMTILLGAIAGISLLVGGIGIMNMMLTTITERTREIGLRKSLGATSSEISNQFLLESISLTFIGGIVGVILGLLASFLVYKFGDTTTVVTINSIVLSCFVSAFIGIVFGYYPAKRASKLNPIEALRYE